MLFVLFISFLYIPYISTVHGNAFATYPDVSVEDVIKEGNMVRIDYGSSDYVKKVIVYFYTRNKTFGDNGKVAISFKANKLGYKQYRNVELPPDSVLINEASCVFLGYSTKGSAVLQLTNRCKYINKINEIVLPESHVHFKIDFSDDSSGTLVAAIKVIDQSLFKSGKEETKNEDYPKFGTGDLADNLEEYYTNHVKKYFNDPFDLFTKYSLPETHLPFVSNVGVAFGYSFVDLLIESLGNLENAIQYMEEYYSYGFIVTSFAFNQLRGLDLNIYPAIYFTKNSSVARVEKKYIHIFPFCDESFDATSNGTHCLEKELQLEITKWHVKKPIHLWSFQIALNVSLDGVGGFGYGACACNRRVNPCANFIYVGDTNMMLKPWLQEQAAATIVHEIGHNFGMRHDFFQGDIPSMASCPPREADGYWIMGYNWDKRWGWGGESSDATFSWLFKMVKANKGMWSTCSHNMFNAFLIYLQEEGTYCLTGK